MVSSFCELFPKRQKRKLLLIMSGYHHTKILYSACSNYKHFPYVLKILNWFFCKSNQNIELNSKLLWIIGKLKMPGWNMMLWLDKIGIYCLVSIDCLTCWYWFYWYWLTWWFDCPLWAAIIIWNLQTRLHLDFMVNQKCTS